MGICTWLLPCSPVERESLVSLKAKQVRFLSVLLDLPVKRSIEDAQGWPGPWKPFSRRASCERQGCILIPTKLLFHVSFLWEYCYQVSSMAIWLFGAAPMTGWQWIFCLEGFRQWTGINISQKGGGLEKSFALGKHM